MKTSLHLINFSQSLSRKFSSFGAAWLHRLNPLLIKRRVSASLLDGFKYSVLCFLVSTSWIVPNTVFFASYLVHAY